MAKRSTDKTPGWSSTMGPATSTEEYVVSGPLLGPQPDAQPSTEQDEHRGLAARILDLRKTVEDHRQTGLREHTHLLQRVAAIENLASTLEQRVDKEVEGIQKMQRELEQALRDGGEQVRKAGELARKMTDQVKTLEELREMAADPHEVAKPIRASIAQLKADVEALGRTIDIRFEQHQKSGSRPVESRSEDELPIVKLGNEVRALKSRIAALEPD